MKPLAEWLLTVIGGIVGGGAGLLIGYGATVLVNSLNPLNGAMWFVTMFFWVGTMLLSKKAKVKRQKSCLRLKNALRADI